MKVQIRFRGVAPSEALSELVTRKVHQHLSRFGHQVTSVFVRLSDINGPKGGADKRCRFEVSGPRIPRINVAGEHEDLHADVDLTLDRLALAIGRAVERLHEHAGERRVS